MSASIAHLGSGADVVPTWGDVLNAEAIGKILAFLESVQN